MMASLIDLYQFINDSHPLRLEPGVLFPKVAELSLRGVFFRSYCFHYSFFVGMSILKGTSHVGVAWLAFDTYYLEWSTIIF